MPSWYVVPGSVGEEKLVGIEMNVLRIWQLVPVLIVSSPMVFSADNICSRIENYTVTSMETYTEPVVVNTFTWCLQIPPRCPKTRTEIRQRHRMKTELKTRTVNECCKGYKMISSDDEETDIKCIPFCEKCLSGVCISPNQCQCIPGYQGDNCEIACPPGTWGFQCREKCNCAEDVSCNPVNGHCVCPPGLRGQMCNESCPSSNWGPECAFACDCRNSANKCHPETGRCIDDDDAVSTKSTTYPRNTVEENDVAMNLTIIQLDRDPPWVWETTGSRAKDDHDALATTDNLGKTTSPETTTASTPGRTNVKIRTQAQEAGNSSTSRPVIVLVSVPERRMNLDKERVKFAMKNPFVRHVDDNHLHDIGPPKTDYVKNIHKDVQPAPIPLDIALIVIASIVSLGFTSVAVVMVLHMRSKLLEAARMSIYEEGRMKGQETLNATKITSMVTGVNSQTPIRLSPLFTSEPSTILATDSIDTSCNYANGPTTIGLRLSGNLHGLLQEDHYDRPPAARIHLQSDLDANTEHIYDEIPLQSSPLNCRKNA